MKPKGIFVGTVGRFVGPGNSHVAESIFLGGQNTLVKQVEDVSWLLPPSEQIPKQTVENRIKLLNMPEGAIAYIGAAMNVAAHMVERSGFPSIRRRPEVLAFFWNKRDLKTWDVHLKNKPKSEDFRTGPDPKNDMDKWVLENLRFLEDGLGESEIAPW